MIAAVLLTVFIPGLSPTLLLLAQWKWAAANKPPRCYNTKRAPSETSLMSYDLTFLRLIASRQASTVPILTSMRLENTYYLLLSVMTTSVILVTLLEVIDLRSILIILCGMVQVVLQLAPAASLTLLPISARPCHSLLVRILRYDLCLMMIELMKMLLYLSWTYNICYCTQ